MGFNSGLKGLMRGYGTKEVYSWYMIISLTLTKLNVTIDVSSSQLLLMNVRDFWNYLKQARDITCLIPWHS
jgi:hypothetical protein